MTLPQVPVFVEAYSCNIPQDTFWKPLDYEHVRSTIQLQLTRIKENNQIGILDLSELKSWEEACQGLVDEYKQAPKNQLTNNKQQFFWVVFCIYPCGYRSQSCLRPLFLDFPNYDHSLVDL